jgi:hypothetical protein
MHHFLFLMRCEVPTAVVEVQLCQNSPTEVIQRSGWSVWALISDVILQLD